MFNKIWPHFTKQSKVEKFWFRNGNIKKLLAQNPAYVNHASENNEEINLCGIDGSKPGAASAGVWLSHRVIGLNNNG